MNEVFARRFDELQAAINTIPFEADSTGYSNSSRVTNGQWRGWATSALSLLKAVFGDASEQYKNFSDLYNKCSGLGSDVRALFNLFAAAKGDFHGGYVFNVELTVSGEVFGDFIILAQTALQEGHKDVAAVLACAALEDALKRYATVNNLIVENKTMTDVINALKGAGLVAGAQKALLDRMPTIRNSALHADWSKISEPDVGSVIGFVEQFLLTKFSP